MSLHDRLDALYTGQVPLRTPGSEGNLFRPPSPDILVYRGDAPPHWHFVSDGIRETYEHPDEGAELSFRVPRDPAEDDAPPAWASGFFSTVANHFLSSSASFEPGHHLEIRGSVDGLPYALGALDPELDPGDDAAGPRVVQLVGITEDDLDAVMSWTAEGFTALLSARDPMLLTELNRPSLRDDPARREAIRRGIEADGCSMDSIYTACVEWQRDLEADGLTLLLDEAALPHLRRLLRGRIRHGRDFFVASHEDASKHAVFAPSEASRWSMHEGAPRIELTLELAEEMAGSLNDTDESFTWAGLPGFTLAVAAEEDGEDDA
jgi:suppressor of fused